VIRGGSASRRSKRCLFASRAHHECIGHRMLLRGIRPSSHDLVTHRSARCFTHHWRPLNQFVGPCMRQEKASSQVFGVVIRRTLWHWLCSIHTGNVDPAFGALYPQGNILTYDMKKALCHQHNFAVIRDCHGFPNTTCSPFDPSHTRLSITQLSRH
jgi:hypothetical protein